MGGLWELRFSATKAWSVVPADPVHAEWYRIEPAEGDDGNGDGKGNRIAEYYHRKTKR